MTTDDKAMATAAGWSVLIGAIGVVGLLAWAATDIGWTPVLALAAIIAAACALAWRFG